MSEWKHQDLERLLGEVQRLDLVDARSVDHPADAELRLYAAEKLSPFLVTALEDHVQVCERCASFLVEAYESAEAESVSTGKVQMISQAVRTRASRWASQWARPLAMAAAWVFAIPAGAWMASHFMTPPVVIQGSPSQTVASQAVPSQTVASQVGSTALPAAEPDLPEAGIQLQVEAALTDALERWSKENVSGETSVRPAAQDPIGLWQEEAWQAMIRSTARDIAGATREELVSTVYPDLGRRLDLLRASLDRAALPGGGAQTVSLPTCVPESTSKAAVRPKEFFGGVSE